MVIELRECVQHQFIFVVLFQMLTNFRVAMLIIRDNNLSSVRSRYTCLTIEFSRQVALPAESKYNANKKEIN